MIDLHAHFVPESVLEAVASASSLPSFDPERRIVTFPSGPSRPVGGGLTDLGGRRRWMTDNDVELQVLSPWTDLTGDDLDRSPGREWAMLVNDASHAEIGDSAEFRLLAGLPADGDDAVAELERCLAMPGFVGGALPTQLLGTDLDAAGLDELFATAARLAAPLFVHPGRVMEPSRMTPYFMSNVCGYPFETTLAALRLYFSGVFDRHPDLSLLLSHCGGTLPLLAGRAAHTVGRVPGVPGVSATPAEILGCFYYDTVVHDPLALGFAMGRVGMDRVVGGSDAPFPMAIERPAEHVRSAAGTWQPGQTGDDPVARLDLTARRLLQI